MSRAPRAPERHASVHRASVGGSAVEPRPAAPGTATRIAVVVAVAHGLNDAYAAILPPLLPRIMGELGLSVAKAATLAAAFSIAASLLQPLLGWIADHVGRRAFVVAGPVTSAVFLSLVGLAPGFVVLLVLLVLGGLGSAAFHPPGASYAARVGEGRGSGVRLSIFSFGGAVGFAVGPLAAVALVAHTGLRGMWVAMIPALVLAPVLWALLPPDGRGRAPGAAPGGGGPPSPRRVVGLLRGPLGLLFGVSALAAFVQRTFVTLQPIAVARAGGSEALGAAILSTYLGAQALGTLAGGWLADRVPRGPLLVGLTLAALPAHGAAAALPPGSLGAFLAAALAGALNMAMLPPLVVTAQELVPGGAAVGSGVVMGLAWAAGSVLLMGSGALGDLVGARAAILWALPALALAAALAAHPSLRTAGADGPGGGPA